VTDVPSECVPVSGQLAEPPNSITPTTEVRDLLIRPRVDVHGQRDLSWLASERRLLLLGCSGAIPPRRRTKPCGRTYARWIPHCDGSEACTLDRPVIVDSSALALPERRRALTQK
jgi:hypothetical protein